VTRPTITSDFLDRADKNMKKLSHLLTASFMCLKNCSDLGKIVYGKLLPRTLFASMHHKFYQENLIMR
jgi:hypothetical protein